MIVPSHGLHTEGPVQHVPDNDRQPPTWLHVPAQAVLPRVGGGSLYEQLPYCERCKADFDLVVDRALVAVHVTFRDVYGVGDAVTVEIGPETLEADCIAALRKRGFTVTALRSDELAPAGILMEVAP